MQMRTGHASGRTYRAERIACLDAIAGFHIDTIEMAVHGHEPCAVVDEDGVAVEEELADLDDVAGSGRADRRAFAGGDVHTGMRSARLSVEETARAVRIGFRPGDGCCKRERGRSCVRESLQRGSRAALLGRDPLQVVRIRRDLTLVLDRQMLRSITLIGDAKGHFDRAFAGVDY